MLFNSYIFIFAFLPLCLIGFYLLRKKYPTAAKWLLVGFSLWFYGYFNIRYLAIMVGSIVINYFFHIGLIRSTKKKLLLILGIVTNLGVLFYFKYFDFFLSNVNLIFKTDIPLRNILLPLGISFFTFQQISFLTDVYRGDIKKVQFGDYALFVSFFPQLIAGPIVTAEEMLPQFAEIQNKKADPENMAKGLAIFVMGLGKKVLIADTFGIAVDYIYNNLSGVSATESLLVVLMYTLQLYFDFSGYCDMAIGIGKLMNIEIAMNFNSPYRSRNICEFWKRWHITLSRFFTKNIYIPMGGNRKGKARMYFNLFMVFFLSGIWHGAGYNFIIWGCMHGVLYVITRAIEKNQKKEIRLPKFLGILLTFIFVNVAWVFFRAPSVNEAMTVFENIFTGEWTIPGQDVINAFNLPELWYVLKVLHITDTAVGPYVCIIGYILFSLAVVFGMPNVHEIAAKMKWNVKEGLLLAFIFVWCIVSLSGVSTFLYFNF